MNKTWTTKDGRELEIMWMDSVHLVHTFNMLLRKFAGMTLKHRLNGIIKDPEWSAVYSEITRRNLFHTIGEHPIQIVVPDKRETLNQLAFLNAICTYNQSLLSTFKKNMDKTIQDLCSRAKTNTLDAMIVAEATKLRMLKS